MICKRGIDGSGGPLRARGEARLRGAEGLPVDVVYDDKEVAAACGGGGAQRGKQIGRMCQALRFTTHAAKGSQG